MVPAAVLTIASTSNGVQSSSGPAAAPPAAFLQAGSAAAPGGSTSSVSPAPLLLLLRVLRTLEGTFASISRLHMLAAAASLSPANMQEQTMLAKRPLQQGARQGWQWKQN